jgi:hypothetical protein
MGNVFVSMKNYKTDCIFFNPSLTNFFFVLECFVIPFENRSLLPVKGAIVIRLIFCANATTVWDLYFMDPWLSLFFYEETFTAYT